MNVPLLGTPDQLTQPITTNRPKSNSRFRIVKKLAAGAGLTALLFGNSGCATPDDWGYNFAERRVETGTPSQRLARENFERAAKGQLPLTTYQRYGTWDP